MKVERRYAAYYCEENIWHLCREPGFEGLERRVVVISNPRRTCALWNQRAALEPEAPVIWDYHVVLLVADQGRWWTWDLDTLLGLPVDFEGWFLETFGAVGSLPVLYRSMFRVMEAGEYARLLRSDREHMRGSDGAFLQPPPPWPLILGGDVSDGPSNLFRFVDMGPGWAGEVLDEAAFYGRFSRGCGSLPA